MYFYISLALTTLICACSIPPRTQVQITDKRGSPIEGFPLRFKLDEGITHTNFFTPVSQSLVKVDNKTFEAKTDADGETGISYYFDDRQPSNWRIILFDAKALPSQNVEIIPLRDIPKGTRIRVGIPNP